MPNRVFVTGGSGFVGGAVVRELLGRGYGVNALVNRKPLDVSGDVQSFPGGLFDAKAVDDGIRGCVAVIHLVGIIFEKPSKGVTFERMHFEGTKAVVDATKRANVRRFVQMSALGTRADAVSPYHTTKWKAERYVRASGLEATIIRPSVIHGPGGEFMTMEANWVRGRGAPWLFMPYFGAGPLGTGGTGQLQPVFVDDVARAFVDALGNDRTAGKTYGLGGTERVTWPQMHRAVATAMTGKPRATLGIPAWYATLLTRVVPAPLLPFNRSQVVMSREDNTTDTEPFAADFGWTPRGFAETLAGYAGRL